MRSGSPAGTARGADRAFGAADTARATGFGAAFFPLGAGCARLVAGFAAVSARAFAGAPVAVGAAVVAVVAVAGGDFAARFAAGRAGAAFATFFAALRSAMAEPYPREGGGRTYVPAIGALPAARVS
jgi:hypothetical protein